MLAVRKKFKCIFFSLCNSFLIYFFAKKSIAFRIQIFGEILQHILNFCVSLNIGIETDRQTERDERTSGRTVVCWFVFYEFSNEITLGWSKRHFKGTEFYLARPHHRPTLSPVPPHPVRVSMKNMLGNFHILFLPCHALLTITRLFTANGHTK